jgi:hypothetical protein
MKHEKYHSVLAALFLALFSCIYTVVNYFWIKNNLSHLPPPWDQSDYIFMGIYEYEALAKAHIFQFAKIVMSQAPTHAPLFPVSTIPFYFFFGLNPYSAYLANSVYLFILLFSVFYIAERLGGKKTALFSVFLVATFPAVTTFSRDYLFEFPLAALTALSYLFFLRSDSFKNRTDSIFFGFFCGLSVLTKTMGMVFFAMPILYAAYVFIKTADSKKVRVNIVYSLLTAFLIASVYYVPNFRNIFGYLFFYGVGEGSKNFNYGISEMSSLGYWTIYLKLISERAISLGYSLIFVMSILAYLFTKKKKLSKDYLLVWLWIVCGYVLLSLPQNKDGERFALPILAPIATIMAVHVMGISFKSLKYILVTLAVLTGIINYTYQTRSEHCQYEHFDYKGIPLLVPIHVWCNMQEGIGLRPNKEWDFSPLIAQMDNSNAKEPHIVRVLVAIDHHFLNINNLRLYASLKKLNGDIVSDFQFETVMRKPADIELMKQLIYQNEFILTKTGFQGPDFTNTNNALIKSLLNNEIPVKNFVMPDDSIVSIYSSRSEKK